MSAGSVFVLIIVIALLALSIRYLLRRRGGCSDCSEQGCSFHGTSHEPPAGELFDAEGKPVSCPAADRMIRDVQGALDRNDATPAGSRPRAEGGRGSR
ncbi:MAG: FeoB-associated Cys-rich membrane protein [Coriobacteriales bacterium]|jgi:hypothetical protein